MKRLEFTNFKPRMVVTHPKTLLPFWRWVDEVFSATLKTTRGTRVVPGWYGGARRL